MGPVVTLSTHFTIHPGGVMLAVNAHASTVVSAVYVQTCSPALHLGIIITVSGMRMALARLALVLTVGRRHTPRLLVVSRATAIT